MRRKRASNVEPVKTDRWLMTYSDMMNNLLVLFIMLYAMSMLDMVKFQRLSEQLSGAFSTADPPPIDLNTSDIPSHETQFDVPTEDPATMEETDYFDALYLTLKYRIAQYGYGNDITLERGENFIKFRFGDSLMFYPDSPLMKKESKEVLSDIGELLLGVDPFTKSIEIGGHTASTGGATSSFFAWELSSNRAIAVLKVLVNDCGLDQSKMSISGFSKYQPLAENDSEENRKLNRRVEVKITRIDRLSKTGTT